MTDDAAPAVEARQLSVCYDQRPALWEAELTIPRGCMTGVVGPNGAGKSTLIKAMLGLVPVSGGDVTFFGKPYREVRDRIAYVPQRESVDWEYPISARDVVAMGLYRRLGLLKRVTREAKRAAEEALDRVGMADFASRRIGALSGGQQQRVFLARALVQQADLYLMDEPFAGIDATTEKVILDLMRGLREEGATMVCVHHDLATVAETFDHAVLLNLRVVAHGKVDAIFHRENLARCYGGRLEMFSSDEGAFARLGPQGA